MPRLLLLSVRRWFPRRRGVRHGRKREVTDDAAEQGALSERLRRNAACVHVAAVWAWKADESASRRLKAELAVRDVAVIVQSAWRREVGSEEAEPFLAREVCD